MKIFELAVKTAEKQTKKQLKNITLSIPIIRFCRAETICKKVCSTMKIIKTFFSLNNLLSGQACSNPAFSSFSEAVFISVKSHYYILQS